jgi:hypothetical protein
MRLYYLQQRKGKERANRPNRPDAWHSAFVLHFDSGQPPQPPGSMAMARERDPVLPLGRRVLASAAQREDGGMTRRFWIHEEEQALRRIT